MRWLLVRTRLQGVRTGPVWAFATVGVVEMLLRNVTGTVFDVSDAGMLFSSPSDESRMSSHATRTVTPAAREDGGCSTPSRSAGSCTNVCPVSDDVCPCRKCAVHSRGATSQSEFIPCEMIPARMQRPALQHTGPASRRGLGVRVTQRWATRARCNEDRPAALGNRWHSAPRTIGPRPLVVAVSVGNEFFSYRRGVFDFDARTSINHAVVVVGWDDARQAWLVRNSWGRSWGMARLPPGAVVGLPSAGYMWIAYGVSAIGDGAAYAVIRAITASSPSPPATSSPSPMKYGCSHPVVATCGMRFQGNTVEADVLSVHPVGHTVCMGAPHVYIPWACVSSPSEFRGLWWMVNVLPNTVRLEITTNGSAFDTQLYLLQTSSETTNASCVASNDDVDDDHTFSRIVLHDPMPRTLSLFLHGYANQTGLSCDVM